MAAQTTADSGGEGSGGEQLNTGHGQQQGAGGAQRRRSPTKEAKEVVDELSQETRRVNVLDRVEEQLKDKQHVSRIYIAFSASDDKKVQNAVEQEFINWRDKHEHAAEELTGVLLFVQQAGLQLLEGPTELLLNALTFFQSLTVEVTAEKAADNPRQKVKDATSAVASPRPALISAIRVLYFTELHGVRVSTSWCSVVHTGKLQGGAQQLEQDNCAEVTLMSYTKMLKMCMNVSYTFEGGGAPDTATLQAEYRKLMEQMPTVDEVLLLVGKAGAELFFSYAEFEKVFMAPFHLVLNSELLWPMPPPLSY